MLTHLSLFTGTGGIDLSAEWAGWTTVGQCEYADYPTKVLEKHWPNVPRWRDIRDVTKESFAERTGLSTVDLISGGFPCQPFSVAGKQNGKDDDRYLWPEMLRVISELKPSWVLGENVSGIVNMALDQVLSDLETEGYETAPPFIIPACGVGALHRRKRVFILAYTNSTGRIKYVGNSRILDEGENKSIGCENWNTVELVIGKVAPCQWRKKGQESNPRSLFVRSDNGISRELDRLKCLGNAVVPQQVYPILKGIAEIEKVSL